MPYTHLLGRNLKNLLVSEDSEEYYFWAKEDIDYESGNIFNQNNQNAVHF